MSMCQQKRPPRQPPWTSLVALLRNYFSEYLNTVPNQKQWKQTWRNLLTAAFPAPRTVLARDGVHQAFPRGTREQRREPWRLDRPVRRGTPGRQQGLGEAKERAPRREQSRTKEQGSPYRHGASKPMSRTCRKHFPTEHRRPLSDLWACASRLGSHWPCEVTAPLKRV